jgi:hypothetical protein
MVPGFTQRSPLKSGGGHGPELRITGSYSLPTQSSSLSSCFDTE